MHEALFIDGCRTPFQKAGTGFQNLMAVELGMHAIKGLLSRLQISPTEIDQVILGTVVHNFRTTNVARDAALTAGIPASVPAYTVSAAGVSASLAITQGIELIQSGQAKVVIAGGTDSASDMPIVFPKKMRKKLYAARKLKNPIDWMKFILKLRPTDFKPVLPTATEFTTGVTMAEFTEELSKKMNITREEQDAYAMRSHELAFKAKKEGFLAKEISSVELPGNVSLLEDNGIREKTSLEKLAKLKPIHKGGTLTAGNSTFLTDGASVVLLMEKEKAISLGYESKAKIQGYTFTAHDPKEELLLGPVQASKQLLKNLGLKYDDIDVFEFHEAFAAQILAVLKLIQSNNRELGEIPLEKVNVWGGSLAIGNPFAPNVARMLTTAVNRLQVDEAQKALVATCAGGGLGSAIFLERTSFI